MRPGIATDAEAVAVASAVLLLALSNARRYIIGPDEVREALEAAEADLLSALGL